jgi:hypothetical protein
MNGILEGFLDIAENTTGDQKRAVAAMLWVGKDYTTNVLSGPRRSGKTYSVSLAGAAALTHSRYNPRIWLVMFVLGVQRVLFNDWFFFFGINLHLMFRLFNNPK